ncbi:HAD-IIA family hydrolase [Bordetella muralis]|uniref:HAD-IIA family hydrolase n=1 Tax=Bordetella muralis TaxID=1649130 RepID=UPI0039EE7DC6
MICIASTSLPTLPDCPRTAPPWTQRSRGLILDLDGTLIRGHEVIPGAQELLARWSERYVIVSNNSTDTAATLAPRLQALGLPVEPSALVLAGEQAVHHISHHYPHSKLMLCGSERLQACALELGLTVVSRDADIVLLARDIGFNYATLQTLTRELTCGAILIVSNGDLTHPGPHGSVIPETGALLQALLACVPGTRANILGKPAAMLFQEGLRRLNVPPADITVIGDNMRTDALGATRLGLSYLLVGNAPHADAPDVARLLEAACSRRHVLPDDVASGNDYQ